MTLPGGLTLGDLDLGGSDAESDTRLDEHFVRTPYAREAVQGKRRIFLGRKGAGKSGLCRILPIISEDNVLVRILSPDDYSWTTLQEAASSNMLPEQTHTQAWRRTLALAIAGAILYSDRDWDYPLRQPVAELAQLIGDSTPDDNSHS